jgi:hypothetical protein
LLVPMTFRSFVKESAAMQHGKRAPVRIFATVSGVFLRKGDTISPAKDVLVVPHTRRIELTVRRSKSQAVSRPTFRLEKVP